MSISSGNRPLMTWTTMINAEVTKTARGTLKIGSLAAI
jgi:hypothetical protein